MQILDIKKAGLSAAMALGLITATAGQAGAFVIDGATLVNDTFPVDFELPAGTADDNGNVLPGTEPLTAEMLFTVDAVTAGMSVKFTVKVSNTSTQDPDLTLCLDMGTLVQCGPDVITTIGFFTNPEVTLSGVTVGSVFTTVEEDPIPSAPGFAEIDICLFANNCAGGSYKDGLSNGGMDTVVFTLGWAGGDLSIDPSIVKFQGDRGSYEFTNVPEPATLLLYGIGLLGLGVFARRRRRFAA